MEMYEIEKVLIKNLFNNYDITINLQDRCLVLIGPNGIGKSSALKILHCIYTGNYIDIVAVPFDYIKVDYKGKNEAGTASFEYKDCFPDKNTLYQAFYRNIFEPFEPEWFADILEKLDEKGLYGTFVYCLYKDREMPVSIEDIIASETYSKKIKSVKFVQESTQTDPDTIMGELKSRFLQDANYFNTLCIRFRINLSDRCSILILYGNIGSIMRLCINPIL